MSDWVKTVFRELPFLGWTLIVVSFLTVSSVFLSWFLVLIGEPVLLQALLLTFLFVPVNVFLWKFVSWGLNE